MEMLKIVLLLTCFFVTVYSLTVKNGELEADFNYAPELARPGGRAKALPPGAVCDKDKDNCQCYGKWHRCECPLFSSGPCTCTKGYQWHCIWKLSCPNKAEWGLDWRNEESERHSC